MPSSKQQKTSSSGTEMPIHPKPLAYNLSCLKYVLGYSGREVVGLEKQLLAQIKAYAMRETSDLTLHE